MKLNIKYYPEFVMLSPANSFLLLFFSLISAFTLMITAISIIPLIRELDKNFELDSEVLEKAIFTYDFILKFLSIESSLFVATSFMILSLVVFSSVAFYIDVFGSKVSALIVKRLRIKAINSLMNVSWPYYSNHGSSDAVNHIIIESSKISVGYKKVIDSLSYMVQALTLIIFSLTISDNLTIIVLISALFVILSFTPLLSKSKELGNTQRMLLKSATSTTITSFDNIKSIKAMSVEHFSDILTNTTQKLERNTYLLAVIFAATTYYRIPVMVALIIVMYSAFIPVEELYYSSLFPIAILFERVIKSIGYVQNNYQSFLKCLPFYISFRDSMLIMDKNVELESSKIVKSIDSVRFDNVSYAYSGNKVLNDIKLIFDRPSVNLIIGSSGSGKTTFIDLIIGLIKPSSGDIFINSVNLTDVNLKSYRQRIGFVPQEVLLFNESLRNNISLGRDGYSDSDIMRTMDLANLTDVFNSLPEGLDSTLGEGGRLLSGGQRQRVLIARALLSKPDLLIFDEPTSGLDQESVLSFLQLLNTIKQSDILVFIISHDQIMKDFIDNTFEVGKYGIKKLSLSTS